MGDRTGIQWTDATWNPVTGCTKVSQGCKHCYAEGVANRWWKGRPFTEVRCHPERLEQPYLWTRPRRIFVNSMSDLFHDDVPLDFVELVFGVIEANQRHTFQILTKRPERMLDAYLAIAGDRWPANCWMGVSIESQDVAADRLHWLEKLNSCPVRFVSAEPLLGPLDLTEDLLWLRWVIAGGESGPQARPMDPAWVRALRDQCSEHEVAFFFKQWGGRTPKAAGAELDGRAHTAFPS